MRRVVVTGLGALTPIGNNVNEFWDALLAGKSGVAPITKFNAEKFKTKFACELKNFDINQYLDKNEIKRNDLFTQYALVTSQQAIEDAQINFALLDKERIGVIWGSGNGGISTFDEQFKEYCAGDGTPRFSPYFMPKLLVDIASGVISIKYGLMGVNFTTVSACASASSAVIEAFNYIRWNKADMIITGGSEAPITESAIGGFNALKALSTKNENYQSASRPFDEDRDGFVMGEGSAAFILEDLEHALKRGAKIYAEVVGGGMAADAYHLTGSHPEGRGAYKGMKLALEEANVNPSEVQYVNAHATSTGLGDASELNAIRQLFGKNKQLAIGATKSMTGHLLGAAGAIEAMVCIKAVQEDILPPTINTENVIPEFKEDYDFLLGNAKSVKVNYALSNTFGFGGHIASVLFKKYE